MKRDRYRVDRKDPQSLLPHTGIKTTQQRINVLFSYYIDALRAIVSKILKSGPLLIVHAHYAALLHRTPLIQATLFSAGLAADI
jgi:hypothetical protein